MTPTPKEEKCNICGKTFKSKGGNMACLVMHAEGTCCHFNQEEVTFHPSVSIGIFEREELIDKALDSYPSESENKGYLVEGNTCPFCNGTGKVPNLSTPC